MDLAKCQNINSMEAESCSGYVGYSISVKGCPGDKSFSGAYKNEIEELLDLFGEKSAKELELSTTIIYLYRNFKMNFWDCSKETIANDVHEIKPHFSLETIKKEYEHLETNGILKRAA